jgi:hypothetical protein
MAGQSIVAVGAGPNSVALGDLDGDGDLDVVTANQGGDNTTASIRINDTSAPPLPLPVELITFQAQLIAGNKVVLAWRTALEKNNDHFAVERSFDGLAFEVMGQVPGHGTSTIYHDYTFTDASVSAYTGTVHYRLRQVDADGQVHVTPIRSLRVAAIVAGGDFHLFPNPATDQALLDLNALPAGTYQVRILDMMGREVHRAQVQGGGLPVVDLRAVKSGTYQLLIQGNQVNLSHKLVKQN